MSPKYVALVRRLVRSVLATVITAILGYTINYFASVLIHKGDSVGKRFGLSLPRMSSYESDIAQHIVKASDIAERMDCIGGLAGVKSDIRTNVLLPLKHSRVFFDAKNDLLRPSKGILFYGPPGTGKTMLARAIAAEAGVPFINLGLSALENKYFGESSKLLAASFSLARKIQPCILFFDEIDGLIRTRSDSDQSCVYGFKTELLNSMDGMLSRKGDAIIIIGCTNVKENLDEAVKRRLPVSYRIGLPNEEERFSILRLLTVDESNVQMARRIAKASDGLSGSDLTELWRNASSVRMQRHFATESFVTRVERAKDATDVIPHVSAVLWEDWVAAAERLGKCIESGDPSIVAIGPESRLADSGGEELEEAPPP